MASGAFLINTKRNSQFYWVHCMALKAVLTLIVTSHFLLLISPISSAANLYRYQDNQGRWVFSDKQSLGNDPDLHHKAEAFQVINKTTISIIKPELIIDKKGGNKGDTWFLFNPLPVTVQHWLRIKGEKTFFTSVVAKPFQSLTLNSKTYSLVNVYNPIEHFYLLGRPTAKPGNKRIPLPYPSGQSFKISQGFKGEFSHSGRGNRYAVDIAMPIGTDITAVKEGIVADVQDHFTLGGAAQYFLDKANHVTVMHDDESYAIYAHILHGSAAVKLGERVVVGDVLARVGNTGFSTGPHLHFVMRYNSGNGSYSIPFQFIAKEGVRTPLYNKLYTAK